MRRVLLKTIYSLVLIYISSQNMLYSQNFGRKNNVYKDKVFNFGFKGGFTSTNFIVDGIDIGSYNIEKVQNNYRIGYFGTIFTRFNIKRHYIQTEVSYTVNKGEIRFEKWGKEADILSPTFSKAITEIHSIDIPILYGYNTIKEKNYGLSIFAGPKLRIHLNPESNTSFNNFTIDGLVEDLDKLSPLMVAGASVNIYNVFFDFRYEHGLSNISKNIYGTKNERFFADSKDKIRINRWYSAISFSLGLMF